MGKHRSRAARRRVNPLAVIASSTGSPADSSSAAAAIASSGAAEGHILPIVQKLKSQKVEDRAWAAAAISNLVLEPNARLELLKGRVVATLAETIVSTSTPGTSELKELETWVELAGALRNLLGCAGDDVCTQFFKGGVVGPLLNVLKAHLGEVTTSLLEKRQPSNEQEAMRYGLVLDLSEQIISSLWSFSEVSDHAVKEIMSSNVLDAMIVILNPVNGAPIKLAEAAAQFVNVLTEENDEASAFFASSKHHLHALAAIAKSALLPTASQQSTLDPFSNTTWNENRIILRLLAASILFNLRDVVIGSLSTLVDLYDSVILPVIVDCLAYDANLAANAAMALDTGLRLSTCEVNVKDEKMSDLLTGHMGTLQLALELLTNMYSEEIVDGGGSGPAEEWADVDGDDEMEDGDAGNEDDNGDDDMLERDADMLLEADRNGDNNDDASGQVAARFSLIVRRDRDIISRVLAFGGMTFDPTNKTSGISSKLPATGSHQVVPTLLPFMQASSLVRLRAFACLTNILTSASSAGWFAANRESAAQVWNAMFQAAHVAAGQLQLGGSGVDQASEVEVVEAAVSAMWAIARGVEGLGSAKDLMIIKPSLDQANALISSCTHLPGATDSLRVKCISTLGIIGKCPQNIAVNAAIGTLLMNIVSPTATFSVEVISEALNAIFDIYADHTFDYDEPNFVRGGYLNQLKSVASGPFRSRVRSVDRRKLRAVRDRADEALMNLRAFITYKEKERR